MCGIVGVFGVVTQKHETAFKQLLYVDALRGKDSTGVASITRSNLDHVRVAKQVGGPEELFNDKRFDECFHGQIAALIGHNRWKTRGAVTRRNAHPFEFDKLVGVHNGTLDNQWNLLDGTKFDVDSEALYNHINEKGAYDALKTARGALALAWYNKEHHTINFYRNHERPLYLAEFGSHDGFFFASEPLMIEMVADRNGLDICEPALLASEFLLSFKMEQGTGKYEKPVVTRIESPKAPHVWTGGNVNNNRQNHTGNRQLSVVSSNVSSDNTKKEEEKPLAGQLIAAVVNKCKGELFEVLGLSQNSSGAEFYELESSSYPEYKFIVYSHTDKVKTLCKKFAWIEGDVERYTNLPDFGHTFVVSPHSVKGLEAVEHTPQDQYTDSKGRLKNKEDWLKVHGYCSFCTGDINPEEMKHQFTKEGEVVCGECLKDPQVREMYSL